MTSRRFPITGWQAELYLYRMTESKKRAVTVREATSEDAGLIAELSRSTFYETFASFNTKENMDLFMNSQFTTEKLVAEVGAPGNTFLLAWCEGEPVGYVRLCESENPPSLGDSSALEIVRIYATTSSIGKGVGSAMMDACIRIARERGKEVIWLGVWEHNPRAIAFYERWGFHKFDTHVFQLGTDPQTDWLMKKELSTTAS